MRRRPALVALAAALAGTVAASLPAAAEVVRPRPSTTTFTTTDAVVPVVDGPADDHAVRIDTRLYVPAAATAAHPQPAILMTNGFGLSKDAAEVVSMATFLARHGYVVLTYSAQGFGASSGCIALQARSYDVKDARQLITKVLDPRPDVLHDRHGAVVGTVGGSYGGGGQANLAESDPRIHAIVPGRTWSSLQYSLDPNNRVVPGDPTGFTHTANEQGVFKLQWTSLFFAVGNAAPVGGLPPTGTSTGSCEQDKLGSGSPTQLAGVTCPGYQLQLCQVYATAVATGDLDPAGRALLADAAATTDYAHLRVPTLLVQGQSDTLFNENDALATYTELRRRHVPVQLIWNSGGHGGYDTVPGECEVYGGVGDTAPYRRLDDCYLTVRTLDFLDHWLRGRPDRSPGFTWYEDWRTHTGGGNDGDQYAAAPAYPAMPDRRLYLSGSSDLVAAGAVGARAAAAPVAGSASIVNPGPAGPFAYSETSNFSGPQSSPQVTLPPTEQPGQHADFTSPVFTRDTLSVGVPRAHLHLSHVGTTDLVLFAKVYDVAPGGGVELIHRLIAPVRVPSAALGQPVDIALLGFAHLFRAGHQVRLTLATTDATSFSPKSPDVVTITTGGSDPSWFSLPEPAPRAAVRPHRPRRPAHAAPRRHRRLPRTG